MDTVRRNMNKSNLESPFVTACNSVSSIPLKPKPNWITSKNVNNVRCMHSVKSAIDTNTTVITSKAIKKRKTWHKMLAAISAQPECESDDGETDDELTYYDSNENKSIPIYDESLEELKNGTANVKIEVFRIPSNQQQQQNQQEQTPLGTIKEEIPSPKEKQNTNNFSIVNAVDDQPTTSKNACQRVRALRSMHSGIELANTKSAYGEHVPIEEPSMKTFSNAKLRPQQGRKRSPKQKRTSLLNTLYTASQSSQHQDKLLEHELHRFRIAVEQKRLELLELKMERERKEMLREEMLFEKELEYKINRARQYLEY